MKNPYVRTVVMVFSIEERELPKIASIGNELEMHAEREHSQGQ
jgi:hypothetical protein